MATAQALRIEHNENRGFIEVFNGSNPVLRYHIRPLPTPGDVDSLYTASGFIHPLYSPSGKILTDAYPAGHSHQHALFNAWTRTQFKNSRVDFWNAHRGEGFTEHYQFLGFMEDGPKQGFKIRRRQVSREHGPALIETWDVWIDPQTDPFIIDFIITQKLATGVALEVEEYHYGGFAVRGSARWNPDDDNQYRTPFQILSPETDDREAANHTRPRWFCIYGNLEGATAGLAVLDHHENFRFPQPIRIHPRMPYFVMTPPVLGAFTLEPGFQLVSRYRVVLFDGEPQAPQVEQWFQDFNTAQE